MVPLLHRRCLQWQRARHPLPRTAQRLSSAAMDPARRPPLKQMVLTELRAVGQLVTGGLVVVTALLASSGYAIESVKRLNPLPPPGQLLALVGRDGAVRDVHVQRRGSGDVTVLFDGGVGETSFDWDNVAADVATFAAVVCIDRPGVGFSAPGALPRTSTQIVDEYRQILDKLRVTGTVVLVAHGAGGYNMRQLAEELAAVPSDRLTCGGLVLVDVLEENLRRELESVSDVVRKLLVEMDGNGDTVLRLARFGLIRLINLVQRAKLQAKYTAASLPYVEYFLPSPAHREGALRENQAIPETEQRFRDSVSSATPFEFPCVVLSHGKAGMFDGMKMQAGITTHMLADLEHKWLDAQIKLANTISKRTVHLVVKDAGHCIHHEKPEEVVKAVRALVDEISGEVGEHRGLMALTEDA